MAPQLKLLSALDVVYLRLQTEPSQTAGQHDKCVCRGLHPMGAVLNSTTVPNEAGHQFLHACNSLSPAMLLLKKCCWTRCQKNSKFKTTGVSSVCLCVYQRRGIFFKVCRWNLHSVDFLLLTECYVQLKLRDKSDVGIHKWFHCFSYLNNISVVQILLFTF